jgi:hypothetical protein
MVIHEEKQQASSTRHAPHIKAIALAVKTNLKHVKDT